MRFFERYVVRHGSTSKREPVWVCQCDFEEYVRGIALASEIA